MNLTLSLEGLDSSDEELRSLTEWLQREDIPKSRVMLAAAEIGPGELGGLSDFIEVLAPGGAGAVLAMSLQTWLSTRRGNLKIRVKRADGSELEIDQTNVKDPDTHVERFLEEF